MARNVAVLGGGISGLTAAYELARHSSPETKIHLIEASSRLGGWLQSTTHKLPNGNVTFEAGPRSMRPRFKNGWTSVKLVDELGISNKLITVSKDHPSAKNRFIFYPDRLNQLPASLLDFISSFRKPALKGLVSSILREPFRGPVSGDETLDSFFRRRFGPRVADNLLSAMIHGIYAGDTKQLSVKALFPSLKYFETKYKSVLRGIASPSGRNRFKSELHLVIDIKAGLSRQDLVATLENASVWSLQGGMQTLSVALQDSLCAQPSVDIRLHTEVKTIDVQEGALQLRMADGSQLQVDHLIAALPSKTLSRLVPALPHLDANPAVSVAVVNLAFDQPRGTRILPVEGFGYLIPRSTPKSYNPHHALGVVFDSDSMPDLDGSDSTYCKMSVLLGGHYYNDSPIPTEDEVVQHALRTIRMHLGINQEPALSRVSIQRDCIPQYGVDHVARMHELHETILNGAFRGRLSLLGASYIGVSVNDCVATARETAVSIAHGREKTGLEPLVEMGV